MRSEIRRQARRCASLLLGTAILIIPAFRGGADPLAVTLACLLTGAALLGAAYTARLLRRSSSGRRRAAPVLALVMWAAFFYSFLQLAPLPRPLLRLLSPGADGLFASSLAPLGAYSSWSWRPLSLDPGSGFEALFAMYPVAAACTAGALLGTTRTRRDRLLRWVGYSSSALAIATLVYSLLGFSPLFESPLFFRNPNHAAAFLQLGSWVSLGFALRGPVFRRIGWYLGFVVGICCVFLTLSRGGIVAFVVGASAFAVMAHRSGAFRTRRLSLSPRERFARPRPVALATTLIALAVAAWLAFDRLALEFKGVAEDAGLSKWWVWRDSVPLFRTYWLTGIGHGAFATIFPSLRGDAAQATFTHLESTWLQIPLDLGIAGALVLVSFVFAWFQAARSRRVSRPLIGALAGCSAVAAHNLVDFSLEALGVAIPFAVIMGIASRRWSLPLLTRKVVFLGVGLFSAIAIAAGCIASRHSLAAESARWTEPHDTTQSLALARSAILWHPADYLPFTQAGADLARADRCVEALPWLRSAMERNPTAPEAHRAAAHCLGQLGDVRAAEMELQLAFLYGDQRAILDPMIAHDSAAVLRVAPDTPDGLLAAARALAGDPSGAGEAYRRCWESFGETEALAGYARSALELKQFGLALELARMLERDSPGDVLGFQVAAEALAGQGDDRASVEELLKANQTLPGRAEILIPLGQRMLADHRPSQARIYFESIVAPTARASAEKSLFIARALEAQGRYREALSQARSAHDALPEDPKPLEAIADMAIPLGLFDQALHALRVAGALPGAPADHYASRISQLQTNSHRREATTPRDSALGPPPDRDR